MKRLLHHDPQQFVSWLLPGGTFQKELSPEMKSHEIQADGLYEVHLSDEAMLLHIEFQHSKDDRMPLRLLEYNEQASKRYQDIPVYSCVIYLFKVPNVEEAPLIRRLPNGREYLRFDYQCVKLWEISSDDIWSSNRVELWPLFPLTREGKQIERVGDMMDRIIETRDDDLVTLAYTIASLVFTDQGDQEILQRRFAMLADILENSWFYQGALNKGLNKGLEKGRKEGEEKGLERGRKEGEEKALATMLDTNPPSKEQFSNEEKRSLM